MKNSHDLIPKIQVNIPFTMLHDTYLEAFLSNDLNPEIGIDAAALERFALADFRRISEVLISRGRTITLHAPFVDLAPGSTDSGIRALTRQRFEQVLELVPLFKPKSVVCHPGYDAKRHEEFKDTWIENSLELWSWLAEELAEQGSLLMLENVFEDGPGDLRDILDRLDKEMVGFCLDPGHISAFGQSALEKWLEVLGASIGQLHLHDNQGGKDAHLAMGKGCIDFEMLFNYLKKNQKQPPLITLEPHSEEELWPSLDYLAKLWPW